MVDNKKLPGVTKAEAVGLKFVAVTEPPVTPLVVKITPLRTAPSGIAMSAFNWSKDLNVRFLPAGLIGPVGAASKGVVVTTACAAGAAAENANKTGKAMNLWSFMGIR